MSRRSAVGISPQDFDTVDVDETTSASVLPPGNAAKIAGCGQTDDTPSQGGQPVQGNGDTEPERAEVRTMDGGSQSMAEEDSSLVQEPSAGDGNVPVVYMTT